MKLTKCPECNGRIQTKEVEETIKKVRLLTYVEECQKCGEQYVTPEECQRVYEIVNPPASQRLRSFFAMPIVALKRLAW